MKHVHFIGIGGTGLSAIARVLLEKGYTVSGSDNKASPLFKAIAEAGAHAFLGHAPEQIAGADLVIRSSAIPDGNPEVIAAQKAGVPVLKRSEFLQELTRDKDTLAVAGSHGKTTTTAMLIWLLVQMGIDPSFIAGGVVSQLGCNAGAGAGQHFVIEADEYDYMFLGLSPKIAIVTNIEHDHPDCFPTRADYHQAFRQFVERVRPDGMALICEDDPEARMLKTEMQDSSINILGYGASPDSDYLVEDIQVVNGLPQFSLIRQTGGTEAQILGWVKLSVPGHHNVLNAAAALAAIYELHLPIKAAIEAIGEFTGVSRRFEILGEAGGVIVIDDYGHHPTQIAATLEAARERYQDHRIWAVWEPHTYSRTQILEADFIQALDLADQVIVLKVYAAREEDPGYSAQKITGALPEEKARYISDFKQAAALLAKNLAPGDVVITFSAGDATEVSRLVLAGLEEKDNRTQGQQG